MIYRITKCISLIDQALGPEPSVHGYTNEAPTPGHAMVIFYPNKGRYGNITRTSSVKNVGVGTEKPLDAIVQTAHSRYRVEEMATEFALEIE